MPLTPHQKRHLLAIQKDTDALKLMDRAKRGRILRGRGIADRNITKYMTVIKNKHRQIMTSGVFPPGLKPCEIHDFIERNQ